MSYSPKKLQSERVAAGRYDRFLSAVVDKDPRAMEDLLRKALKRTEDAGPEDLRTELTVSLAEALVFQDRLDEALSLIQAVLKVNPSHEAAVWWDANLAFKIDEPWPTAWKKLDNCWDFKETPVPSNRVWDGSPLNGRTILWAGESGLGDQIQFARFIPLLKDAGAGRVIVSAHPKLHSLFRELRGVDSFISKSELALHTRKKSIPYDVAISMAGVPSRLGTTQATLPVEAYLRASPGAVEAARRSIGQIRTDTLNVGLCWQSFGLVRGIPLESLRPFRELPGVRLFGLGEASRIRKECMEFAIEDLGADVENTAGAIEALDLTISVDTMAAHLAGSLGRPAWVILSQSTDWRWPLNAETTPWYPSLRLYHRKGRDLEGLIRRMAVDLAGLAGC